MSAIMRPLRTAAICSTAFNNCLRCNHFTLAYRSALQPVTNLNDRARDLKRCIHGTAKTLAAPKSKDRGPESKEDTQTDFNAMNVLGSMPPPTTAVDMCLEDGFAFNSGLKITDAGAVLAAGEAFAWRPWIGQNKLRNKKGQFEIDSHAWGLLKLLWPKPDLLIIGTGSSIAPLAPETRQYLNDLGVRVEVQDTRNAAAQFNLLATERGVQQVAAALIPIGHKDTR